MKLNFNIIVERFH